MRSGVKAFLACGGAVRWRGMAQAQFSDGVIKIGVMNDQSGLYADLTGQGSVWAAKKAIAQGHKCHDKIEVVFADHQNKPDVGSNVVRQVRRRQGRCRRRRAHLVGCARRQQYHEGEEQSIPGLGCRDVRPTGKACTPNTVHWTYDTWALANGTGNAIVKTGGDTWYFLTADYRPCSGA